MAASNLNLGKASGGVLNVQPADGTTTTSLVLPAINGTVVAADSNGNVGIGIAPANGEKLQIKTGTNRNLGISDQTTITGAVTIEGIDDTRGSNIPLEVRGSTVSITRPTGTTAVFDSSGNVGIGVTPSGNYKIETPYNYLGSFRFGLLTGGNSGANYPSIGSNFRTTITSNSYLYDLNNLASMVRFESGGFQFLTAPSGTAGNAITWTNAMTLDSNGVLGVKGSVDSGYSGGMHTGVEGQHFTAYAGDASNYTQIIANRTSNGSNYSFTASNGGILRARILDNGNFQSATNSYGSTSDAKLKENIQDASPKLDKLMQVQVRTFNYIGQEDKQIGVIAQEIEKIFPSIVYETKDTKQVEVEKEREVTLEDGTVDVEKYTEVETIETGEVTKNVKYSVIYMMMLKGLQELNGIVKEQNEIIKDLKSRIEILEAK